jgi:hypothetical protein
MIRNYLWIYIHPYQRLWSIPDSRDLSVSKALSPEKTIGRAMSASVRPYSSLEVVVRDQRVLVGYPLKRDVIH